MDALDLRDGYGDGPVTHARPLDGGTVVPCCLRDLADMPLGTQLASGPEGVTCRGKTAWHRGDRLRVRETGQGGIVEGWKGDQLLVFWGSANGREYRSWVREVDCDWMPQPKISSG